MIGQSIVTSIVSLLLGVSPEFPVPRAQAEFAALGPHVRGYCGMIRGDLEAFRRAVLPFGPMDLNVKSASPGESRVLRDLYLGFAGSLCEIDAGALAESFRCGKSCIEARKTQLEQRVAEIRKVVEQFRSLGSIEVIAQWGKRGEYRVDNVFVMMGQTKEAKPSREAGFVPSDSWVGLDGIGSYLRRRSVSERAVEQLVSSMAALSLAAVAREKAWVRVIRVGIVTNESGVLFLNGKGSRAPAVGDRTSDGRQYIVVDAIAPTVAYYETQ